MEKEKILAWMSGTPEGKAFRAELASEIVAEKLKAGDLFNAKAVDDKVKAETEKVRVDAEAKVAEQRAIDTAVSEILAIDKTIPEDKIRADVTAAPAGVARDATVRALKAEAQNTANKNRVVGEETVLTEDPNKVKALSDKELRAQFEQDCADNVYGQIENEEVKNVLWTQFKAQRTSKAKK